MNPDLSPPIEATAHRWDELRLHDRTLTLRRPLLMGIVNVTPDSFSDGGLHQNAETAVAACRRMILEGADLLDLGAESSRPGSEPVSAEAEIARLDGILQPVLELGAPVSIDTTKPEVADWCLSRGAHLINDITGLGPGMVEVASTHRAPCVVMHMDGEPKTMQAAPHYEDVVAEVLTFLDERIARAREAGVQTLVDPGFGFGKTLDHNLELLRRLDAFRDLGPLLVGISRKSMLGALTGASTQERLTGTLATSMMALDAGASVLRVHDVGPHRHLLQVHGGTHGFLLSAEGSAQIRLDGIEAELHLGVPDEERARPQTISVDLELEVEQVHRAAASDQIEHAVDYAPLPELVRATCAERPVRLLEALAQRLAETVLAQTAARSVRVRLSKPAAAAALEVEELSYTVHANGTEPSASLRLSAVALGSNLGRRRDQLDAAVAELRRLGVVLAQSDWIETNPEHGADQPRYLNGVVTLRTALSPEALLDELLNIERRFGRTRPAPGEGDTAPSPRSLDLDLLFMEDVVRDTSELTLPHPRMQQRHFVLGPLSEIESGWTHPVLGKTVKQLLRALEAPEGR